VQAARIERCPAGRRLPHRDEQLRRRDEVDLLKGDPIVVRKRVRSDEDSEDVRAVTFEHRPRLAPFPERRGERLDDLWIDVDRERREHLLARGVDEIDPSRHRRRA
jgi:hypothetical protein